MMRIKTVLKETMIANSVVSLYMQYRKSRYTKCKKDTIFPDSSSKKSCQGCELPSDDVPDSTSNSRGHNNNTPSATNNNSNNGSGKRYLSFCLIVCNFATKA